MRCPSWQFERLKNQRAHVHTGDHQHNQLWCPAVWSVANLKSIQDSVMGTDPVSLTASRWPVAPRKNTIRCMWCVFSNARSEVQVQPDIVCCRSIEAGIFKKALPVPVDGTLSLIVFNFDTWCILFNCCHYNTQSYLSAVFFSFCEIWKSQIDWCMDWSINRNKTRINNWVNEIKDEKMDTKWKHGS